MGGVFIANFAVSFPSLLKKWMNKLGKQVHVSVGCTGEAKEYVHN